MEPNLSERSARVMTRNREAAERMGHHLEFIFPQRITDGQPGIPQEYVDDITDHITLYIAEILQAWLDAGSERENTQEELYTPIRDHIATWAV